MGDERQQFLDEILAEPDNDEPRLVYADWLLDRGDPRGEFIHLQCARHQLPEFSPDAYAMRQRERQLLREHRAEWVGELEELLYRYEFRRGFIEWGRVNTDRFIKTASQLFRLTPLRHVMLARGEVTKSLAECVELKHLQSICFSKCQTDHLKMLQVLESPYAENVTALGFAEVGDVPLRRICAARPKLDSLYFANVNLRGFDVWLDDGEFPPLRSFRLKGGQGNDDANAMNRVVRSSLASSVEEFGFCQWDSRISDLTRFDKWERLRKLAISLPTDAAVLKLADSTTRLEALSIETYPHNGQNLSPAHFAKLLASPMLSTLRVLRICGMVSDSHAIELAKWPRVRELYRLNLASNSMTADGMQVLLHAIPPENYWACDLRGHAGGEVTVHRLQQEFGPHFKRSMAVGSGWYLGDTQGRDWSGSLMSLL